jgi:hypothetical protein
MSATKTIAVIAGATLGLAHGALAQSEVDQSRAYQAEMMRDTDARSSYAQSDLSPTLWGQIQIRYTANSRDNAAGGDEDFTHGFSNRRTKIGAEGGNDQWAYKVNGGFNRAGGAFALEDAWVDYTVNDNWIVKVGQFKLPLFYEESTSSSKQLAADRSLANEMFNQDRSQGIMATWDNGQNFRVQIAASDGAGTANTDFDSADEADYGFTGRVDWKDGDWRDLSDFTSEANGNQALRIGGFAHFQDGGSTGGFTNDTQVWVAGADVQWERAGWSAFASAAWIHSEPDGGDEADDLAFVVQGGYRFDQQDEIFARGSMVLLDDRTGLDVEDQIEILVGYNHYFDGHATKFTVDAGVFLEPTNDTIRARDTSVGILPADGDPQLVLRAQLQVLF